MEKTGVFLRVGGTLVSALVTALLNGNDITEMVVPFGLSIPLSLITFLFFLGFTAWWIIGLEMYKNRRERSKPNICVQQPPRDWQFYSDPDKKAIWGALQIWFVNKPKIALESSIGEDVTATIVIYDTNSKKRLLNPGCFIEAEFSQWANIKKRLEKIEHWAPNNEPRKLQVAVRWPDEDDAYAFVYVTGEGREEAMKITKGCHYLAVLFRGLRIDQPALWFVLENPGRGEGNPFLSARSLMKKPNLRKEGFQTE
ncbi:MAG: hypothetical protein HYX84_01010 [Chloroflexi bacterium]|nr:hypothetical protein [Chloroflexota bacterium]